MCPRRGRTAGGLFLQIQCYLSGTLVVHVSLDSDPALVADLVDRWALGAGRHAVQVADSVKRDRERQQLEHAVQVFVASASSDELSLFGEAFQAFAVGFQRRFGPLPDDQRSEVKD